MESKFKVKIKQFFCLHDWKYWEAVSETKHPQFPPREIRSPKHFRKCVKCEKKMRKKSYRSHKKYEVTDLIWDESYPIVGKIPQSMKREKRLKELLDK